MQQVIKVGPKFVETRIKAGYSLRSLARESGRSSSFLPQFENGLRNVGPQSAKKICSVLNAKFDELFIIERRSP
jgi:transcriptional regulator with XRE-family HTH domain